MATDEEKIDGLEPEENNTSNDSEGSTQDKEVVLENLSGIQGKITKFKKLIIIVSGVLTLFIVVGLILYFIGFFDSEPEKIPPPKDVKVLAVNPENTVVAPQKKKYEFKVKDIDRKRLNRKLSLLTKNEIMPVEKKPEEKIILIKSQEIDIKDDKPIKKVVKKIEKKIPNTVIIRERIVHIKKPSLREIEKNKIEMEKEKENISIDNNMTTSDKNMSMIIIDNNVTKPDKDINAALISVDDNITTNDINMSNKTSTQKFYENNDSIETNSTKEISKKANEIKMVNEVMENEKNIKEEIVEKDIEEKVTEEIEVQDDEDFDSTIKEIENKITDTKDSIVTEKEVEDKKNIPNNSDMEKRFLKFTQVATIKQRLYLSYLSKINKIDKRISVCRNDDNEIQVFVGPFNSNADRQNVLNRIHTQIAQDAFSVDFTQEEFDKRCKL